MLADKHSSLFVQILTENKKIYKIGACLRIDEVISYKWVLIIDTIKLAISRWHLKLIF
jgi:hypothetical protein